MATRDYAKNKPRGKAASRAPQKKAAPKAKAKPQPKASFPLIRVLLSVMFLGGFGYALWQLTSVSPDPQAEQQTAQQPAKPASKASQPATKPAPKPVAKAPAPTPKPKPAPAAKPAAKPSQPVKVETAKPAVPVTDKSSEHYEFYDLLKDSEVDTSNVDAYTSTPKTEKLKKRYLLQTGSFRNGQDAEQMRARLILQGLPNVHTKQVTNNDGSTWFQVRVGPFDNRSQLNKAQDKLVRLNIDPLLREAK